MFIIKFCMENNKKRIEYIDEIRGILIIFMVFFHINFLKLPLWVNTVINNSCNIGVFFILSGFFFKDKMFDNGLLTVLRSKFKNLYIPSMYICLPIVLFHNLFFDFNWYSINIDYGGKLINKYEFLDFFKVIIQTIFLGCREPLIGAMWFVFCLMISLFIYIIVSFAILKTKYRDRKNIVRLLVFTLFLITSHIISNVFNINVPRISNAFSVCILIFMGSFIFNYKRNWLTDIRCFILACLVIVNNIIFPGEIIYNTNSYTSIYYLLSVCLSSLFFLSYIFSNFNLGFIGSILSFIGKNSFYVMGLHMIGFKIVSSIMYYLFGGNFKNNIMDLRPISEDLSTTLLYLLAGILIPLVTITSLRKLKI